MTRGCRRLIDARATGATFTLLYVAHGALLTFTAAVLLGIGMGVGSPPLNAFLFELFEPRFKGLNANPMMLLLQGGNMLGPIVGGAAVAAWGYDGFLLVGAVACALGLLLSLGLGAHRVPAA